MTKREKSHLQYIKDCEAFLVREGWTKSKDTPDAWLSPKGNFHFPHPQDAAHVWAEMISAKFRRKFLGD